MVKIMELTCLGPYTGVVLDQEGRISINLRCWRVTIPFWWCLPQHRITWLFLSFLVKSLTSSDYKLPFSKSKHREWLGDHESLGQTCRPTTGHSFLGCQSSRVHIPCPIGILAETSIFRTILDWLVPSLPELGEILVSIQNGPFFHRPKVIF